MTPDDYGQMIAADQGAVELHVFLAAGGDVYAFDPRSAMPLLHLACEHQNLEAIRALVGAGANLEARDLSGQGALHIAVDIDIDSVVQANGQVSDMQFKTTNLLLELGANPEVRDNPGRTPRDIAAAYGQVVLGQFDRQTRRRI